MQIRALSLGLNWQLICVLNLTVQPDGTGLSVQPGDYAGDGRGTQKLRRGVQDLQLAAEAGACLQLRHRSRNYRHDGHQRDRLFQ